MQDEAAAAKSLEPLVEDFRRCGDFGAAAVRMLDDFVFARDRLPLPEAAARVGGDPQVVFAVGPVEMEFEVELRADAKAKAGFKVWAVGAETEAGLSRGRTHRVSFTLTPKLPDGTEVLVDGSDRAVGGVMDQGRLAGVSAQGGPGSGYVVGGPAPPPSPDSAERG